MDKNQVINNINKETNYDTKKFMLQSLTQKMVLDWNDVISIIKHWFNRSFCRNDVLEILIKHVTQDISENQYFTILTMSELYTRVVVSSVTSFVKYIHNDTFLNIMNLPNLSSNIKYHLNIMLNGKILDEMDKIIVCNSESRILHVLSKIYDFDYRKKILCSWIQNVPNVSLPFVIHLLGNEIIDYEINGDHKKFLILEIMLPKLVVNEKSITMITRCVRDIIIKLKVITTMIKYLRHIDAKFIMKLCSTIEDADVIKQKLTEIYCATCDDLDDIKMIADNIMNKSIKSDVLNLIELVNIDQHVDDIDNIDTSIDNVSMGINNVDTHINKIDTHVDVNIDDHASKNNKIILPNVLENTKITIANDTEDGIFIMIDGDYVMAKGYHIACGFNSFFGALSSLYYSLTKVEILCDDEHKDIHQIIIETTGSKYTIIMERTCGLEGAYVGDNLTQVIKYGLDNFF